MTLFGAASSGLRAMHQLKPSEDDRALPAMLIAAVVTFVATNIDDLVLLTGWFSDRSYRARHIAVGQFLGIAVLVAVSVLLGLAGLFVPIPMMGILGVIPAGIGISRLIRNRVARNDYPGSAAKSVLAVAGVTIAHGSDNIAITFRFSRPKRLLAYSLLSPCFFS
jgi:cadmium resistance protein CadD (predicted permease)